MTMAPTLSRSLGMLGTARQDSLGAPLDTQGLVEDADAADRPESCPAAVPLEDQRERAQQEFKRIWNLCTLTH